MEEQSLPKYSSLCFTIVFMLGTIIGILSRTREVDFTTNVITVVVSGIVFYVTFNLPMHKKHVTVKKVQNTIINKQ